MKCMNVSGIFIVILGGIFSGCKSGKVVKEIPVRHMEVIKDREVPVYLSPDTLLLHALFECDSLSNVVLKELAEQKTKRVSSEISFKNGAFDYQSKIRYDTLYVTVTDTVRITDQPIITEVPVYRIKEKYVIFMIMGAVSLTSWLLWFIFRIKRTFFS